MRYPVCTLSNIINPGKYCVVSTDKEHVLEVMEVEEKMSEMVYEETSGFEIKCQMCVAVIDCEGKFKRGVIEKKIKHDLYEVILVDYGQIVEVNKSEIRVIMNEDFMKVEPLAFLVKLYGLIPSKYFSIGSIKKARACKQWSQESTDFVHELFRDNRKIVVQSLLIQQRTVYGDLYVRLQPKTKFVSLRKLLCKNEFCAFSESNFLSQEGMTLSDESVELSKKMEWVKKWQMENFGIESCYRLPKPVSTSNISISNPSSNWAGTQTNKSSEENIQTSVSEKRRLGLGRGKLKLLIAEMKYKQTASECAENNRFPFQSEPITPKGRGYLLKKYLESIQSSGSRENTRSSNTDSREHTSGMFSSIEKVSDSEVKSKVERVVIQPGEFSEFNDSNELTEMSLSTLDGPPPLIRNIKIEKAVEEIKGFRGKPEESAQENWTKSNEAKEERSSLKQTKLTSSQDQSIKVSFNQKVNKESSKFKFWKEKVWERSADEITFNNLNPFVLFDDSVVEPVQTFRELPIQSGIIKNLERGGIFDRLSPLQRWAIPAIRKQHNTILIGSSKTGKTLSYVVPLMDYVQDQFYFEELPKGNGPIVVVVASSSSVCESIYYLCYSLLGLYTKVDMMKSNIKIEMAHGGGREKEVWPRVSNGCDVLITTPHCLVRLLEQPILTNFQRLMCLVLDEVDIICQNPFRKNVRIIFEKAEFATKNRHYQKILCGEKWTPNVENIVKTYVESHALVIGSYSEVVIYAGLPPRIFLVDKNRKAEILLDQLKKLKTSKIVIVCEETSEASSLSDFLQERGIPSLLAHENIMADKLKEIQAVWKASNDFVLIFTDDVLNELNIRNAQTLIHYELPSESKTNFYLRYLTLENFLREKQSSKDKKVDGEAHDIILIDDENHYQLPHIVDFVTRLKGKLPGKIVDKCQEIRRLIEVSKCNVPLCENLLSFGRCRNSKNCSRRHAFVKEFDSNDGNLPTKNCVKFIVLKTHDASWFSARLTEHFGSELPLKISNFYRSESNRKPSELPKIGDVVAVMEVIEDMEVFHRAKVVEFLKLDKFKNPLEVSLKLIDRGDMWKRKTIELYELPSDLSSEPPTAVDIRLVGVQPKDFDSSWSEITNCFVQNLLSQTLEEDQCWSGKITLSIKGNLFLESIKRQRFLPNLNVDVFDLSLGDELLNNKLAVLNNDHLPSLLKLCAEGDIEVPKKEETDKEVVAIVQPQWAFFDSDFVRVRFLAAESNSTVFLQLRKFENLLFDLEEECTREAIATVTELKSGKAKKPQSVTVGMYCLALFEGGKWNRGRIESENEAEFQVFFVDHGDFLFISKSNVVPISETLLFRLPCQAIECRLTGVEDTEDCPLEVLKEIYAFSEDGAADLYASVISKDLKTNVTGGKKYSLNLVNETGVSLNKILIDREMVRPEESEREHLKDIEMGMSEEEEDVEVEDMNPDDFGHLLNLTEDMFEDEAGQEFLREFASKVFDSTGLSRDEENVPEITQKSEQAEEEKKGEEKEEKPSDNTSRLLEMYRKRQKKKKEFEFELKGRENVLTPRILWFQNNREVRIKILLSDVKDFSFESSAQNISFRCVLGEKFYAVDLKLFGGIDAPSTTFAVKAFHVLVVLKKIAFPPWPRLPFDDGKHRWIGFDVEGLSEKSDNFSELIKTAKSEIESGLLKKGTRSDFIFPCSDSEDSLEGGVESDASDSDDSF